ncbi:glycosyltransferase family 4 protein [Fodinicurvata sp. EGI_FJ10296]|uniref:glycosyltransferase family 4 protein n=1 Tax=Fodinicurvata sp. EGI_FJ10296 TaxID=3231908 RepID=UPI0034532DB3
MKPDQFPRLFGISEDPGADPFAMQNRLGAGGPTVLQVVPELNTGGVERGTVDMVGAITRAGGRALVVSSGGRLEREVARLGGRHITLPVKSKAPLTIFRNIRRLEEIIRDQGVDIVHARSRAPAWSAYFAAQRCEVAFVTTFHGVYNGHRGPKRLYNSVMARGDRVIAISHYVARHIRTVYGTDWARIRVIHRGIDTDVFRPDAVSPERSIQLATKWRLPDDKFVILLPARLTRWKGALTLIRAAALLNRDDIRILLVGDDQGRTGFVRELEKTIAELNLTGVVQIAGHCDDMAAAYKLSDVVVHASVEPEGFGRVIVEAQALGRPVIATRIGAPPETVVHEETGWLVDPDDPQALADALTRALSLSPAEREIWAARAIENAHGRFTRERMATRTLALYGEVTAHTPWLELGDQSTDSP